jgi:hypothetical protein
MPGFVTKATASNFHAGPNAKGRLTRVSLLCRSSVIAGDVGNWVASPLFVDKFDLSEFELVERSSGKLRSMQTPPSSGLGGLSCKLQRSKAQRSKLQSPELQILKVARLKDRMFALLGLMRQRRDARHVSQNAI